MKITFEQGTNDMLYQVFDSIFKANLNNKFSPQPSWSDLIDIQIDIIVKSFLYNKIKNKNNIPYCFSGFLERHGRYPEKGDHIVFYYKGDMLLKYEDAFRFEMLVTSVLNWELKHTTLKEKNIFEIEYDKHGYKLVAQDIEQSLYLRFPTIYKTNNFKVKELICPSSQNANPSPVATTSAGLKKEK